MRVGLVCPYSFDHPGGVQAHVLDLGRHLLARGHEVRALGPADPATPLPAWVTRGGPAIAIPYNGSVARIAVGPQVIQRVDQFVRSGRFDVLHIHEPNSPSYSMVALARAQGPIVATYHASASNSRLLKVFLPVMRPALEKIRGGIAVSEMARRWQVEQLGGDPVLIPNGVDTAAFAGAGGGEEPSRGIGGVARETRGPASEALVRIVFLGRLDEPRKGLRVLLEALEKMQTRKNVAVTVIGAGTSHPVPGVEFVGQVSDDRKAQLLREADIYVAPNLGGESFGIVLVEAMAAGCAVVASDLEAFAAVCAANTESVAGALFRTGDAAALARVLDTLVGDPGIRHALAIRGRARAKDYDWSTVTDSIEAVYETVADGTTVRVE